MSIRPLILKDGVITPPRSSTDTSSLLAALGLNNVNNTSDLNKPLSNATQSALTLKADLVNGVVPSSQLPSSSTLTLGDTSTTAYRGDLGTIAYNHSQITSGNPHGLTAALINLGNVSNTSDANKPVSTAQQTALDLKANLISPNLSGTPTTPTATAGTNTTQVANCAFVTTAISAISTSNFVDLSTNQTITGVKIFSGSLQLPNNSGSTAGTIWRSGDNLEYKDGANVTNIILNSAGNLSNLMNKQASLNNLVGTQVANRVLRSDGTNVTLSQVNLSTDVTNTLSIINGGTGSSTKNFVDLTDVQSIAGSKTFTNSMTLRGDVGIMNLFGNNDTYNTFRFTGNTNTASSYWDMGVMPSVLNRDFYIGSGWSGSGQIALKLNATNGSMTVLGNITTTSTTQTTSTTTGSIIAGGGLGLGGTICAVFPTSPTGLSTGTVWRNGNVLNVV